MSKGIVFVLPIEPIETRYTKQWHKSIPEILLNEDFSVSSIDGDIESNETSTGAFLNFAQTNIWKNTQINKIAKLISENKIQDSDIFLVTDAWNTAILQLRYMLDLHGIKAKIHAIWHAGSYDPNDFLGKIPNTKWAKATEIALYEAIDINYFATKYHAEMFISNLSIDNIDKIRLAGQPHDYLIDFIRNDKKLLKKNQIVFPARLADEKQPEIFYDLMKSMPDIDFVVCQESKLTKKEYHKILNESKVMFSASLQETLGICQFESALYGAIPFVPNRLSHSEIMENFSDFLYDSEWTENFESYLNHKDKIIDRLYELINNYDNYVDYLKMFDHEVVNRYMSGRSMFKLMKEGL